MLFRDGIKVIDGLKAARHDALARLFDGFLDLLLDALYDLRDLMCYFHFFRDLLVGPVDAGDVGEKVKGQIRIVAQECRHGESARGRKAQRVLRGGPGLSTNSTPAPGTAASIAALISSTVFISVHSS